MRAVLLERPHVLQLIDKELPKIRDGWALIRVAASCVCATDLELIGGNIAAQYPVVPGHEWSGVVEAVGTKSDAGWVGKRVVGCNDIRCLTCRECRSGQWRYCADFREIGFMEDGAYAEYLTVPVYCLCELPANVSFVQGALVEPLAVAIGSLRKGDLRCGETVTVIGAGSIGLNILAVARVMGAIKPLVMAKTQRRLGFAQQMGAYATLAMENADPLAFVKQNHDGLSDIIVETTGIESCIQLALRMAKKGGRVVLAGYGRGKNMQIRIDDIHINNLKLIGAGNNWNCLEDAVCLLETGQVSTELLATHSIKLKDYNTALEMAQNRPDNFVKAVFEFDEV